MASILKVDQIQTAAGGTPTAADLGIASVPLTSADIPTGGVIQVVTNTYTAATNIDSAEWANAFGVDITPKFANSKLYIVAFIGGVYMNLSSQVNQTVWRIARDSGDLDATQNSYFHTEEGRNLTSAGTRTHTHMGIMDNAVNTNSRNYSVQVRRLNGSGGIRINDTAGTSTITVMEFAG